MGEPECKERRGPPHAADHDAGGAVSRRRVLSIVAAVAGVPLLVAGVRSLAGGPAFHRWQGEALGALSEISLWHPDEAFAQATIRKIRAEIARFERIFSLYRTDSEIVRLNAAGRLAKPSRELVDVIAESQRLSALSGGAFDISVQPLWRLYEAHFWSHAEIQPDIAAKARDLAAALVDFRALDAGRNAIGFARPRMAITLNAIAQGFVTDAIADLVRNEGFENALIDLGEIRAIGRHPEGRPWRLAIRGAAAADGAIALEDMALAVSGGDGTPFEPSGRFHHVFDPHTGLSADNLAKVAVIAPRALQADALSTAILVAGEARAPSLLAAYPQARAILTRLDGSIIRL